MSCRSVFSTQPFPPLTVHKIIFYKKFRITFCILQSLEPRQIIIIHNKHPVGTVSDNFQQIFIRCHPAEIYQSFMTILKLTDNQGFLLIPQLFFAQFIIFSLSSFRSMYKSQPRLKTHLFGQIKIFRQQYHHHLFIIFCHLICHGFFMRLSRHNLRIKCPITISL